jgi:hypothetical protein
MELVLPRELIDAKTDGDDDQFIVLVDDDESDYFEKPSTDTERDIVIQLPAGAEEIEIVGTQVVPEFPVAVMAVMSILVGATIAVRRFNFVK